MQQATAVYLRPAGVIRQPPSALELHAHLNGQLVARGDVVSLGQMRCTVERTVPAGRALVVHHRTALHLQPAPTAGIETSPLAIFDGQRRAYDALCAMVSAFTAHGEELRAWRTRPPAGLLLYGPPGTGKTHVVRAAAAAFALPLVVLQGGGGGGGGSGGGGGEVCARLRTAFAQAETQADEATAAHGRATPALLFLDEIDTLCPKRSDGGSSGDDRRAVAQLLTLLDGVAPRRRVLAVAATNRAQGIDEAVRRPGRLEWEVPLALPSRAERRQALEQCCAAVPLAADGACGLDAVADATNGYAAADLLALAREAAMRAVRRAAREEPAAPPAGGGGGAGGGEGVSATDWREALAAVGAAVGREQLGLQGGPTEPLAWEEIGGLEEVKRRLRRAVEWPLHHAAAYRRLGIAPPKGVLLHGPPGCSKTSLARAAAGGARASFFYLSGAALYSPYVGEAERRLREFFAVGRATAPAILFLDELEALVGSREAAGGGDAVQQRVLSTLLNEMDGVAALEHVLLIGATNRPDLLDAALLRPGRFDEQLLVPPPDEAGREQVLRVHTRRMPLAADVALAELAARSAGWSGAQLAGLCREAGMEALRGSIDASAVQHAHFEAAFGRVHGAG